MWLTMGKVVWFLFVLFILSESFGSNFDDVHRLLANITDEYDTRIRPPDNQSEQLYINSAFFLLSIHNYDQVTGILSLVGGLTMLWVDERLMWNESEYSSIPYLTVPKSEIWVPDIVLTNSAQGFNAIGREFMDVKVSHDGSVAYTVGDLLHVQCTNDKEYFPFDSQICNIKMGPWITKDTVSLQSMSETIDMSYFSANNIWELIDATATEDSLANIGGLLKVQLIIRHKPLFVTMNMLSPIFMLTMLNPLVFLMPIESGERISYTVTIFLSFEVFLTIVSDKMPESSSPMPTISYFLFAFLIYSALIAVMNMVHVGIYFQESPVSGWQKCILAIISCGCFMKEIQGQRVGIDEQADKNDDDATEIVPKVCQKRLVAMFDKAAFIYCIIFQIVIYGMIGAYFARAP